MVRRKVRVFSLYALPISGGVIFVVSGIVALCNHSKDWASMLMIPAMFGCIMLVSGLCKFGKIDSIRNPQPRHED